MAKVTNVNRFGKEMTLEQMLRAFKKKLDKEDTLRDIRKHDYYLSPSQKKKLKSKYARQRRERELAKKQAMMPNSDK
jgi:small subunit ribosomal protein S21